MRLFVYGTLRQGCPNHRLLFGSRYLGPATTAEPYVMVTQKSRSFPYIFKHPDLYTTPIRGEMYEINQETVRQLDALEGHPDHYRRQQILVTTPKGDAYACAAYLLEDASMIHDINESLGTAFVFVPNGDWTDKHATVSKE